VIHYPPHSPAPEGVFGAAPHTDYGCLTILAQDDIGGLEVARREAMWISATPVPGTFVINIGDILARWTNDVFTSTLYRVINRSPDRDRYSTPFFFDPNLDAVIEPFSTCIRAQPPARYESMSTATTSRVGSMRTT
jgi:isopenicillin N synthase-like dioxygenase